MDAYFSGDVTKAEMLQMKAKYDQELDKLDVQLCVQADRERAQAEQAPSLQALVQTIRDSVTRSEEVFAEVVEEIVVYQAYITVKVRYLSLTFRLWYTTSGTREHYTTNIERWEIV